jgi:hypothetical protein
MLRNASTIKGYTITASDGHIGTASDFLFEDDSWLVRWLVVDTGHWLSGRKVLLPLSVLGQLDPVAKEFAIRLSKQQIKDSPEIDSDQPVSRQMETDIYDYYGWRPYWGTGYYMGGYGGIGGTWGMGMQPYLGSRGRQNEIAESFRNHGDPHLRSVETVIGYHIHARDGEIGHVEDFLLEDADWSIHYLVVDTANWWPAKKVLISPRLAGDIDWLDRLVKLDVDRQTIKDSPAYDPATTVDRTYENHFHAYYGKVPVSTSDQR